MKLRSIILSADLPLYLLERGNIDLREVFPLEEWSSIGSAFDRNASYEAWIDLHTNRHVSLAPYERSTILIGEKSSLRKNKSSSCKHFFRNALYVVGQIHLACLPFGEASLRNAVCEASAGFPLDQHATLDMRSRLKGFLVRHKLAGRRLFLRVGRRRVLAASALGPASWSLLIISVEALQDINKEMCDSTHVTHIDCRVLGRCNASCKTFGEDYLFALYKNLLLHENYRTAFDRSTKKA
ncbi:hypothetical protein M569_10841 [Genlisea aurea]|uniref:Uncharacterized protein n=1 Tax=Genlisea aurea TaxID=192259 RepID=S8CHB0_9LAMI|nr:hypothetical protein M569_10841 [Genlisea aurea]